jgi:hypothetical protein
MVIFGVEIKFRQKSTVIKPSFTGTINNGNDGNDSNDGNDGTT